MKKNYTRKQIQEAINHWQKKLSMMNESSSIIYVVQAMNQDGDWEDVATFDDYESAQKEYDFRVSHDTSTDWQIRSFRESDCPSDFDEEY